LEPSDPLDYSKINNDEEFDIDQEQSHNELLLWLSSFGRGTWQQFKTTCRELALDSDGEHSKKIMRRLRSLGHIELINNGQNWIISPPCLVETCHNSKQYHAYLAGQRSPILIQELKDIAQLEFEPQPYGNAPKTIRLIFNNQKDAEEFCQNYSQQNHLIFFAGRADLKITCNLPDLDSWESNLPIMTIVRGYYSYEQWITDNFYPIELPNETGLFRLTHRSDRFAHPKQSLFYDKEKDIWRKGDWYGLRYLMLQRTGNISKFYYNHNLSTLAIKIGNRIPDMYERSLILASGRLPLFRHDQIIYCNISEDLAHILANKLEAKIFESNGVKKCTMS
jgi:hypothetical protein